MSQDPYKYWSDKLKSGEKPKAVDSDQSDDDDDDEDDGEVLDEDFSASEVKFTEPDEYKDDDYSMDDEDDFAISSSFKQAPILAQPNRTSANNSAMGKEVSAAQDRLNKILEEEEKAARQAKLDEIMRQQKAQIKQQLGDSDSDDDDDDQAYDSDEEEEKQKPKTNKTGAKVAKQGQNLSSEKKPNAVNYFMKKAGKDVEESSEVEISDEDQNQVPLVDNSGSSYSASLEQSKPKAAVAAVGAQKLPKQSQQIQNAQDEDDFERDDDDDFEESKEEMPTQSMNVEQPSKIANSKPLDMSAKGLPAKQFQNDHNAPATKPLQQQPQKVVAANPAQSSMQRQKSIESETEPEEVINDFEEESIQDEMQASESFSVHNAEADESRDKVMELQTQQQKPGNSTVNMASVVPTARIVNQQLATMDKTSSPNTQTVAKNQKQRETSPMFVKAKESGSPPVKNSSDEPGLLAEPKASKPRFVKHSDQITSNKKTSIKRKPVDQSPSPNTKRKEEEEINEQLKEIKPRYANRSQSKSKSPVAVRPKTAKPAPATSSRVSANNRDLAKVQTSLNNNFVGTAHSSSQQTFASRQQQRPASNQGRPQSDKNQTTSSSRGRTASASKAAEPPVKREKVNYAEITLAQPPEEKKFFKYEPKKSRHQVMSIPKAPKKPRKKSIEVVADEADAEAMGQQTSQSPEGRTQSNYDLNAVTGLQALTVSTMPGISQGIMKAMQSKRENAQSAVERKKAAATAPGSSWGSRVVPDAKKSYSLPDKVKPKVKEETKKALKQGSRLATIKKEDVFVKEKNPTIPTHKVQKKPQPNPDDPNKNKAAAKAGNDVVVHRSTLTRGTPNTFDPVAMMKAQPKTAKKMNSVNNAQNANKGQPSEAQFKMPSKNRAFDNIDLDGMFDEADIDKGDQSAPPLFDDDFAEGEILAGDQNKADDDFVMMEEEDEIDMEADEEDREFLKEINKPGFAKQSTQKKTAVNKTSQLSSKREQGWFGNGVGSGNLQVQKKKDEAEIGRKNINMALQPAKKEAPPKPVPWGFNKQKTKVEVNKEEQERKRQEAQEKFKDLQHQKKEQAKAAQSNMGYFVNKMAEVQKKDKKDSIKDAVNPLVKNAQVKDANMAGFIKSGVDRVPAEAGKVHDAESNSKQVSDLQKELKQLFFENKQINKQVQQVERKQLTAQSQLENLMKEKNLVKINGKLETKTEFDSTMKRILKAADIPDYDKIKERANPLEPVVAKFAERGFTPLSVFTMLDIEDEDDILTFSEIKNGLKRLKITLLDTEWKLLFDAIDKDGDGAVTIEEWQDILQPKLNAQREFLNIMKDLNINDPLVLEEQILDILYQKRRLGNEVKVMRRTYKQEHFFRKKQIQQEQKAVAEKIKTLQEKVKNSKERTEEENLTFDEKMKSGAQTKADVEAEYEQLMSTKQHLENEQKYLDQNHRKELLAADQLFHEVNQYAMAVKTDRDRKRIELKKMSVRLQMQRDAETSLDKELESILGRAVTMEDLEASYKLDLKLLGQIEAGLNNKIGSLREIIMARYVQKTWRGYVARKQSRSKKEKRQLFMLKYNVFCDKMKGNRREWAAKVVARHWRQYALSKENKNKELQAKLDKQMEEKKELLRAFDEEELERAEWAAIVMQKNWRAYVARKQANASNASSMRFIQEKLFNPFEALALKSKSIKPQKQQQALGRYNFHAEQFCMQCDEKAAKRRCLSCQENLFCETCFVQMHIIGTKKRHMFFDITYDTSLREGPSTWTQPAIKVETPTLKIEDVPEREASFMVMSEISDDLSSESFERVPQHELQNQANQRSSAPMLQIHPFVPSLHVGYGSNTFFGSSFFKR